MNPGYSPVSATVLFPTYGLATFAFWALKSVVDQTVRDIEIFVICDGSPPGMVSMFNGMAQQDKRIRVFEFPKSERTGEPYRDLLIKNEAKGTSIYYCSHDDLWLPDHIYELEKTLKKKDFAHSLNAAVSLPGNETVNGNIFQFVHYADLSDIRYRNRMLNEDVLQNFFGLTFAAHSRKSYLQLNQGWTTTPPGIWTDLYMWRKFLVQPGHSFGTCKKITALNFPASLRKHMTMQERSNELELLFNKMQDITFIRQIRKRTGKRYPDMVEIIKSCLSKLIT